MPMRSTRVEMAEQNAENDGKQREKEKMDNYNWCRIGWLYVFNKGARLANIWERASNYTFYSQGLSGAASSVTPPGNVHRLMVSTFCYQFAQLLTPATPGANTSSSFGTPRPTDRPNTLSNVSPAEAAGIIAVLKDKSVDELRKLLSDKEAYQNLLLSVEPVKTQNRVRDELRNETLQLANAMSKTEEESETLHRQLLDGEIDLSAFVQKYKKMRYTYHKRALTHLAAKTSAIG
ncbi:hypothetical protein DH2020_026201 [Rehmannia glutinosa]|uniref:VPS37 C-terminal domain-containing protein n=1 Tax=Rehmannia glutinosa TaxID=99300 RepID=A0ABR0W0J8_REHGL